MRTAHYFLILIAPFAATPVSAQSRPDIPERARIRIQVLRADSLGRGSEPLRGTGVAHRVAGDSIAFRLDGTDEVHIAPWARVQTLQLSEGMLPVTFMERIGVAVGLPALGAVLGYAAWHDCNVPDREFAFGCLPFQGQLGTAVQGGAWLGLAVGLPFAVAMRKVERWRNVDRPFPVSPFVGHSARSGFMLGASLRF